VKQRRAILAVALAMALMLTHLSTRPAQAAVHEIVAAYCSGGGVGVITTSGFLEPPGVNDPSRPSFARPVIASGAVDPTTLTVTDRPNTKYPAGTSVLTLGTTGPSHPSADHCPNNPFSSP
jgi:hypothetical protein